jgi:hypothetical protein
MHLTSILEVNSTDQVSIWLSLFSSNVNIPMVHKCKSNVWHQIQHGHRSYRSYYYSLCLCVWPLLISLSLIHVHTRSRLTIYTGAAKRATFPSIYIQERAYFFPSQIHNGLPLHLSLSSHLSSKDRASSAGNEPWLPWAPFHEFMYQESWLNQNFSAIFILV